jgi:hypothetical protein
MLTRHLGRQVAGPGQHNRPATRSQWFATMLSGSTTLSRQRGQVGRYGATADQRQHSGPLSGTTTGLVMQRQHVVPLIKCKVAGNKARHVHIVEDIICYS